MFVVNNISFCQCLDVILATRDAYHKLTIIAGPPGAGKTRLLKQISCELKLPIINLSLLLSQRLINLTQQQRALKAEETAIDGIDQQNQASLCLDNTEILFDQTLRLNVLGFLQNLSRNRFIIATWNGPLEAGRLIFGYQGHPDYFSQSVTGFPVVTLAEDKLQLYLTT